MQNQIATLPVVLTATKNEASSTRGEVRVQYWDKKDRFRRAAITWACCWGGAILAIPFPLIHFVLIPVLLLGGPILASIVFNQKDVMLGGSGTCPNCGKPMKIVRARLQWPLSDLCTECNEETRINPA